MTEGCWWKSGDIQVVHQFIIETRGKVQFRLFWLSRGVVAIVGPKYKDAE
jgi:hypothetical protein